MAEADPIFVHRSFEGAPWNEISDKAHRARSVYLDSCARLESQICALAVHLGIKCEVTAPIGQRIAAFRSASISDKKRKARLDALMDELSQLAAIRAHIVHAAIRPVLDLADNTILIQFQSVPLERQMSFCVPLEDLNKLPGRVASLANRFKQFQTQPAPAAPAATNATA